MCLLPSTNTAIIEAWTYTKIRLLKSSCSIILTLRLILIWLLLLIILITVLIILIISLLILLLLLLLLLSSSSWSKTRILLNIRPSRSGWLNLTKSRLWIESSTTPWSALSTKATKLRRLWSCETKCCFILLLWFDTIPSLTIGVSICWLLGIICRICLIWCRGCLWTC